MKKRLDIHILMLYIEFKNYGFNDDYIFGIVGGLVMTTYLESPKFFNN